MWSAYENLPNNSKVWVFQSDKEITSNIIDGMQVDLRQFIDGWVSHSKPFPAHALMLYNRFIVVIADESATHIGGCSMDTLMRCIDDVEKKYDVQLKLRNEVAYLNPSDTVPNIIPLSQLKDTYANGVIHENTIVFDNLVNTKQAFESGWKKNISESWHKRFL